ncbi:MAG: DNA polymerase III subunit alpha [Thermaurantimonas sp.]
MFLIFDTETTGLPKRYDAPITQLDNWPRVVQIAWQLHDSWGNLIEHEGLIIYPDDWEVPYDAEKVHGISTALARKVGSKAPEVFEKFLKTLAKSELIAGHNLQFDINVIASELYRHGFDYQKLLQKSKLDTCDEATAMLTRLPGGKGGKFKFPTLTELYQYLFGESFEEAHNATADVEATARCFFELIRSGHYSEVQLKKREGFLSEFKRRNPQPMKLWGLVHKNLKNASTQASAAQKSDPPRVETTTTLDTDKLSGFFHIFNKTRFSVLSSTIEVSELVQKAAEYNFSAVGIADTGNMMAAFQFMIKIKEINANRPDDKKLKGIIGCELELVQDIQAKSYQERNPRIVLYAKNKAGYANLSKLVSIANTDGFYYNPRIDKKHICQYKDNLIALSGTLWGELPQLILTQGKKAAEEALLWWKEQFDGDFYIQLNRHGPDEEKHVNEILIELAREHHVKTIATNNNYYLHPDEFELLDTLICIRDGNLVSDPIGKGRGHRFGYTDNAYYFRPVNEMATLYADIPEALYNLAEIADKVENYDLKREVLLPEFKIPDEFKNPEDERDGGKRGENSYLRHIAYEGARQRYPEMTDEIRERIEFELETIEKTGYPGYFLIVSDFCRAAREMGVVVGPGRGSAAGSVVAYCIGITNVDPIKYNLLFERFLNPERVSLPDIDTDFDDEGRDKVIKYVIDKYGANQVAQIITYGTMAAKSSVRDCGRVLGLSPTEVNILSKKVPTSLSLGELFRLEDREVRERVRGNELPGALEIRQLYNSEKPEAKVLRMAEKLEGALRNTGIHACGIIITPTDVRNLVPVARAKDSEMWCTQFDNNIVESAGLLKMDFLGLKTLTIIKDACQMIKKHKKITIDPDQIPLDDPLTYEKIFQTGDTIGVFQLESPGMQKYLRQLRPTSFEDIIAMVALYRPGPMEYIPDFIDRKHGRKPIEYDLPEMEEYLRETYGVTVYQEQVMLLSQKLAGFTKGEADVLRKAMGKKQKAVLDKMKPKFIDQASAKGYPVQTLEKIWSDWEAFASYAFNKSHATCYAVVAFQTAYLKAHHPAEFMAATITHYQSDVKTISFYMEDCRRHKIPILGPSVNESDMNFSVNAHGEIRFGLAGMKGVGEGAAQSIIEERQNGGPYISIFDFVQRTDQRIINKKVMEALAIGGAFDDFSECHRATYFSDVDGKSFIETLIRYGQAYKSAMATAHMSLFGDMMSSSIQTPAIPASEPWTNQEILQREAEINGLYLSGHPLDDYRIEYQSFATHSTADLSEPESLIDKEIKVMGMINTFLLEEDRNGERTCRFEVMDYDGTFTFRLRSQAFNKLGHIVQNAQVILVTVQVKRPFQRSDGMPGNPYIDVTNIEPATELSAKAQRMTIYLSCETLEDIMLTELHKILTAHPGTKSLRFVLEEEPTQTRVLTLSKIKINISRSLIYNLNQFSGINILLQ